MIVANSDTSSPFTGSVDEVTLYGSALSPARIQSHFDTASRTTAGAYHALARSDGALLQLTNNVVLEPTGMMLLGASATLLLRRRASRRPA